MTSPALEVRNLHKRYGDLEVLKGVDLIARDGDVISILGSSGSGKSTLLRCINLLENPHDGQILVAGEELKLKRARQGELVAADNRQINRLRARVGFVFQSFNLIDELNVYENVELPLIYTRTPAAERRKKVEFVLEKMNMAHRLKHFPRQLSGGQQQRVAVARAIVNTPKLILADEPTGNLDSEHGAEVMGLLSSLNAEGTTIVMVTHSPEDASVGSRIIRMLDGRIVSESATI